LLLALARLARADEPAAVHPSDETIVIVDRTPDPDAAPAARDRDRALGDAPFVTIVHADDHGATTSVADALGTTVGVQTRSLGGLGAYEQITVRGAAPGHTTVLVDGIPLARLASVTQDLGRFTLGSFGEVELYRGAVPVELGGAGLGGAVNMVTRLGRGERGERVRASLGAGSFGARHLRLHYGDSHRGGSLESATTIGYQAAAGDYSYFSDNGTPLNTRDDAWPVRHNNDVLQIDGSTRVGTRDRSVVGGLRAAYREQGLPGSATQPSYQSSLATLDTIADGRFDAHVGDAVARQLGYLLVERQQLRDPDGEIGLGPQDRVYRTLSGGAQSTWSLALGPHRATAGVELRGDHFRDEDRLGMRAPLSGDREGGAALAAIDLALDPDATIVVTPSARFDVLRTAPTPNGVGTMTVDDLPPRWDTVTSPRVSARALVTPDVAVKASAGYYVRMPTLVELFGNHGTLIGSPELRPERGPSTDVGVVWAPAKALGAIDRIVVEASAFGTRSRDTIAFVTSVGYVARALNVANSQTYGGELVASARIARAVSLTVNYTRLVTEQLTEEASFDNKALPREPGHAVYARIDGQRRIAGHRAQLWLDASWQSATYLDQANLIEIPARTLAGAGTRVEVAGGVNASLVVENALDVRLQHLPLDPPPRPDLTSTSMPLADIAGFPLPGRTVYLTLDWSY
jgi:iron complex outermembrane receptor protein